MIVQTVIAIIIPANFVHRPDLGTDAIRSCALYGFNRAIAPHDDITPLHTLFFTGIRAKESPSRVVVANLERLSTRHARFPDLHNLQRRTDIFPCKRISLGDPRVIVRNTHTLTNDSDNQIRDLTRHRLAKSKTVRKYIAPAIPAILDENDIAVNHTLHKAPHRAIRLFLKVSGIIPLIVRI